MTLSTPTIALGALLFVAPAYAAGYSVTVNDTARAGTIYDAGGGSCTYNVGPAGGSCSASLAHYGGVASATINPAGGAGGATSVASTIAVSGGGAAATSKIKADLASATLHLFANDSDVTSNCSSPTYPCGYSQVSGELKDTLHFTVAGANANTVTPIKAIFTLEGTLKPVGANVDSPSSAYAEIYGALNFAGVPSRFDLVNDSNTGFATQVGYLDNYPSGISPTTWTTNADHTLNVSAFTYDLTGASGDVSFDLSASLLCDRGFVCDFGHTAKFALDLQQGTTFTSDSGVFLTAPSSAAPEPGAWVLMLAGFGLMGGALRRRRDGRGFAE